MKSDFIKALLLASVFQLADTKLYEEGKVHYHTFSINSIPSGSKVTKGWSQSTEFTLMKPNDFEEPLL
jgi:hypothetical protein